MFNEDIIIQTILLKNDFIKCFNYKDEMLPLAIGELLELILEICLNCYVVCLIAARRFLHKSITHPHRFPLDDNRDVCDGHVKHAGYGDTEELVAVLRLDNALTTQGLTLIKRNQPGLRSLNIMCLITL